MASIINVMDYLVQLGQLQTVKEDRYGGSVVTSTETINCLVFAKETNQVDTATGRTQTMGHFALIPNSLSVTLEDHLVTVVDSYGSTVLAKARIKQINNYHTWWFAPSTFKELELDLGRT